MSAPNIGWLGILRLGLVQTALGAVVVLTTTTLNRVMIVELALPAMLPGMLVGFHYAVQILRPRLGYGSDVGGRRTPWILGGILVLAAGGVTASFATALMETNTAGGVALATVAFLMIGAGVSSAGTALLALLATRVSPERRAPAAMVTWVMMIAGFAVTAGTAGHFLDPFSMERLVGVTSVVCALAVVLAFVAVWGVEGEGRESVGAHAQSTPTTPFFQALGQIWDEPKARRFTIFVFFSMLAYNSQDLILEPFAGLVFGLTPGQSTQLGGFQNGGVLAGMLLAALAGRGKLGSLRTWTIGGCIASSIALGNLIVVAGVQELWWESVSESGLWRVGLPVFTLGAANGAFAVAAIGSMMRLASEGQERREGVRVGLWGAAQAIAFGLGGFLGTVGVDAIRYLAGDETAGYSMVFGLAALLFLVSAWLAARVDRAGETDQKYGTATAGS
ncbi:MAG: BCD family MFS transporter [Halorhodospira halophila]|uniref:BCD family MFS transporter n=1 Tax=Halorhodospira halophila TaxID=1053 RepID=UPI0026F19745|nr:BCD family MFS transporter [Halorhodospira halophila]MCC3751351.1 BCD family MFS transporter [Halorhodospira halophila]